YALRNTSSFFRFQRTGDSWEARDKSGRVYRYGSYPEDGSILRSREGKGDLGFQSTYKWLVDELLDTNNNRVKFVYVGFDDSPGQLYVSEIRYNFNNNSYHSVVFNYESRPDVLDDYRAGFLIRTGRRVSSIQVLALGEQVREYRFKYEVEDGDLIDPFNQDFVPVEISQLKKVVQYDRYGKNYLPPLRLEYTKLHTKDIDNPPTGNFPGDEDIDLNGNGTLDQSGVQPMLDAPSQLTFQDGNSDFIDINSDGLVDILDTRNGQHTYYLNLGNGRYGSAKTMQNAPFVELRSENSTLADLDGDGKTDLLNRSGASRWTFYR
ncbi:MAG: VCBS repeat-containing protein, partial [Proteobacteria bacterium]|nr:VCBS repeat-containing protein [Pseudomonadota bacterium]